MKKSRISLRELAKMANCHYTTVSRALKGHPGIPQETRERIEKLAQTHHYRPDPALGALNAYRNSKRKKHFQGTLAWLDFFPGRAQTMEVYPRTWRGCVAHADTLGYQVEMFWGGDPAMKGNRLSRILRQRGIQGLLFAPLPNPGLKLEMEWEWFSCVSLSPSLLQPQMHAAYCNQFESMRMMVRELYLMGYRRLALAMEEAHDERVRFSWTAGFIAGTHHLGIERKDAILRTAGYRTWDLSVFESWVRKTRPDVIIAADYDFRPVLAEMGLRVPEDIGCVWTDPRGFGPEAGGLDQQFGLMAQSAVNFVVAMIQRAETGLPTEPLQVMNSSLWVPGSTVRQQEVNSSHRI
ncbi:MAG: LacI family DNA-binding transcriptional regulator [Candidatus Methylacidiphilales bacterium]|nr:LacI family DNA-binding transcriptional regulator [Candidatus Methylacidiphilales bacterium]